EQRYGLSSGDDGSIDPDNGPDGDPDEDGVNNEDEYANRTNPIKADTDLDGLDDGVETNTGIFVSATDTGTDPTKDDTDGDGLTDKVETNAGTFVDAGNTGTNPNNNDSDGDGFADGFEVDQGSDPNNPQSTPAVALITIIGGLLGGDLTDPENDGIEGPTIPGPPQSAGTNFNWLSISASIENYFGNFGGSEGAYDIFDNTVGGGQAKWCCDGPPQNATVEFEEPVSLTHFTITSGNDTPDRDPRDWQIQGSNDGINFEPIFVRASNEVVWTARNQTARVDLPSASDAYKYIRYEVTRTNNANHQINEIEYFGSVGAQVTLQITAVVRGGDGSVSITFNTGANKIYAVDASSDLFFWEELDDGIIGVGGSATFTHSDPSVQKIFYRVREVE
ncbi:MAG: discoidin domain-containing protein, partial [Verrucomicrobiales bacterium]